MHLRAHFVQGELELGDDPEVPPSAAQRPIQIGMLGLGCGEDTAVRGHDLCRHQVVAAETGPAREPPDPPTQGQAADAGVADHSSRGGEPVCLGGGVEFGPGGAPAAAGAPGAIVDLHVAHGAEVDHQTRLAHPVAGEIMASTPHRDLESFFAPELDGRSDLVGGAALGDDRRSPVDVTIPQGARAFVAIRGGYQHVAGETLAERVDGHAPSFVRSSAKGNRLFQSGREGVTSSDSRSVARTTSPVKWSEAWSSHSCSVPDTGAGTRWVSTRVRTP